MHHPSKTIIQSSPEFFHSHNKIISKPQNQPKWPHSKNTNCPIPHLQLMEELPWSRCTPQGAATIVANRGRPLIETVTRGRRMGGVEADVFVSTFAHRRPIPVHCSECYYHTVLGHNATARPRTAQHPSSHCHYPLLLTSSCCHHEGSARMSGVATQHHGYAGDGLK